MVVAARVMVHAVNACKQLAGVSAIVQAIHAKLSVVHVKQQKNVWIALDF
jgi:hypothetical protein